MATGRLGFVKRAVTEAVSGALNFGARVNVGIRQTVVGNLLAAIQRPALTVTQAPSTLLVTQRPAFTVSMAPMTALAEQRPAFRQTTVATLISAEQRPAFDVEIAPATLLVTERPAFNLVQVQWDLSHLSYVVTGAEDAVGTGTWANPTRIQDTETGTQAGSSQYNSSLVLGNKKLRGTAMVAQPNRPASLLIYEVYLRWHYQTSGIILADLVSNMALGYRIGALGNDFAVFSTNVNEDFLVAGREFEITLNDGAGGTAGHFQDLTVPPGGTEVTWANIAALQPYFHATTVANPDLLISYFADAIRLRVVARETQLT